MSIRRAVPAALVVVLFGHWAFRSHVPAPESVHHLADLRLWSGAGAAVGIAAAVAARTWWLLARSERAVGALPVRQRPPRLEQALAASGPVPYAVSCVASGERTAFAVGGLRPHIYVTSGLVGQLDVRALAAVIAHEVEHARRRDPARRAVRHACADLCWQLPIAGWWVWLSVLRSELAADRVASARFGQAALARALVASASPPELGPPELGPPELGPEMAARHCRAGTAAGADELRDLPRVPGVAFHTAARRRAARLLGEDLPPVRPRWPLVLGTVCWLLLAFNMFACTTDLAAAYLVFRAG